MAEPVTGAPSGLVVDADGVARCAWAAAAPEYAAYHDTEWGRPVHGETALYERVTLEAFQSGLSWLIILRKRERFRRAFDGFDAERVAGYGSPEVARLLGDPGIVRNRSKIVSAIANAQAVLRVRREVPGGLDALVWSFAPDPLDRPAPRNPADVPARTVESSALARRLKGFGFTFVGPTTCYATMQACGLVDDHFAGCDARGASGILP